MKTLLKTALALTLFLSLSSCSKDEVPATVTNAKIMVIDSNGPVSGMVVYVYDETTWNVIGDDILFAKGQAVTDAIGQAIFPNVEYTTAFNDINNNQNTMRFSAHYTKDGVEKTKVTAISFTKGESKTGTILLD